MDEPLASSSATRRYARKKELILSAATHILNRRGVKGMTLSDVAASVGLITTSVTYYFKRKEDLAAACLLDGLRRNHELIAEAASLADPQARIRSLVDSYIELLARIRRREAPPLPYYTDVRALREPHYSNVITPFNEMFRALRRLITPADSQWIDPQAATARTHLLVSQLFRLEGWLWRYDIADYDRLKERIADTLLNGVGVASDWAPVRLPDFDGWRAAQRDAPAEDFLRAASALINQRGYRGASVSQIAAELNVTKGAFYHHNSAKDDLVIACFGRSFDHVRRAQSEAMALAAPHRDRLASAVAALCEIQFSERSLVLGRSVISSLPGDMRHDIQEDFQRATERFAAMISDGIADGSVRPVYPMVAANLIMSMLNSSADLARIQSRMKPHDAPALYARPLLAGLFIR